MIIWIKNTKKFLFIILIVGFFIGIILKKTSYIDSNLKYEDLHAKYKILMNDYKLLKDQDKYKVDIIYEIYDIINNFSKLN